MVQFQILDNATAGARTHGGQYAGIVDQLSIATKNEAGNYVGAAVAFDKPGSVLSLRAAAKVKGFAIVTRKQEDGKLACWKIPASDVPARKPRAKKAAKKA